MLNKLLTFFILTVMATAAFAQPPHVCQKTNIPEATPSARFVNNGDGTITDSNTDLMWKQCLEGLAGDECELGEALALNWAEALLYLPELNKEGDKGYMDWRMPNIRELSTLVETQCMNPSINTEVFPGTPATQVWTSSPYQFYTHYSWYVDFGYGSADYDERIKPKSLRLVRDLK